MAEELLCMGIDIESGAPGSKDARYSVAFTDSSGAVLHRAEGASLPKVIRLAWERAPKRIGIDNVYELAESERSVLKVLSLLPPRSEVVQVTLVDGEFIDVREAARRIGIVEEGKPTPLRTAILAATIACKGLGTVVRSVEERTIVQVSKLRSPSPGGWSQQRYQRKVRAAIYNVANSIRELLDRVGMDYDYYYRESKGGLEAASFTIYAPREEVEKIIEDRGGPDYSIKIMPAYRNRLLLVTPKRPARAVIVGVDAGTTTGLAILDMEGNVLYSSSAKNLDRGTMIDIILGYGRPIIVATDVAEAPETVKKLASQLGAALYTPPEDLSVAEKRELAERLLNSPPGDSHERDAIAAAAKAFHTIKSKLEQIEKKLDELSAEIDREKIKRLVMSGLTLAEALERTLEETLEERREEKIRQERRESNVTSLVAELEISRAQKRALEERVRALEEALRSQERRMREALSAARQEALRDQEVRRAQELARSLEEALERAKEEAERLRREVERLRETATKIAMGELVPARRLPSLTVDNVRRSERQLGPFRPGELVIVENPGTFEREAITMIKGVAAVLMDYLDSPLSNALRAEMVPVIGLSRHYRGDLSDGLALLDSSATLSAEEARRELEAQRAKGALERILREYRAMRRG